MRTIPLLLCDFYKTVHSEQYPKNLTKVVSYYTPRTSRIEGSEKVVMFGLQAFIKEYLVDYFRENFFNLPLVTVMSEYKRLLGSTLGDDAFTIEKVASLHMLGYLPIQIRAIAEGERVNIHIPMFEITNTHGGFAWLVNALETLISCNLWYIMQAANVGYEYRQIVNKYYDLSVEEDVPRARALGDFSMRGQSSLDSAVKASSAFCLSFLNTATVPVIPWLEYYYKCNCVHEPVAFGSVSTEHSVMCSNFAADGDEITMVKRLLTETYPNTSFSMVSDSYDYWNLVDNILPLCKQEILNHEGTLLIRGDSGDAVEIVTQTVFRLWETFGGTINSKGYKVLDPHIKAIYGDSITQRRCEEIYNILIKNGFACNNVALGVGSFSMLCLDTEQGLQPYTRDTYGVAIKATYCEINNKSLNIFKNPKTDVDSLKKSQKGCCIVTKDEEGNFHYTDGHTFEETIKEENVYDTVFFNGNIETTYSLKQIRNTLHNNKF